MRQIAAVDSARGETTQSHNLHSVLYLLGQVSYTTFLEHNDF